MNRIYRRVWSTALQCWVVASELAARKGKAGRAASATGLTVLLSMLAPDAMATKPPGQEEAQHEQAIQEWAVRAALGLPSADIISPRRAIAPFAGPTPVSQLALTTDTSYANSTVNGNHLVVLGSRSSLTGNFSVGYGNLITTRGDSIVAIGYNVKATNGGYNTAVGTNAIANGVGATVYGNGAQAHSENSVAMGSGAVTHDGAGIAKIAIGGDAYAGSSGWTGAIAIGGNSRAEYDGIAIGHEASTSANGTVALGRGSVASVANTVSVGNATSKRRIVNVANGDVNTTSTDAVNGRQLNAVSVDARTALGTANTAKSTADRALAATGLVTQTSASSAIRVGGANTGSVVDVANRNGGKRRIQNIDNGVLSASSTDAVTGQQLHATNQAVTTATSTATAAKTAADGAAAKATVAANTTATGTAMTSANKATATGTGALASGTSAKAQGTHATALGFSAQATANQATAVGREAVATGSYATAVGNLAKAGGGSALALGDRSSATHGNAVALGAGSVTASDNSVSVGNASGKRKIQYVGDGTIGAGSTDAVTGSQLHATNTLVGTAQSTATSAQTAAGAAQRTADALTTRATALEGLVSQTAVAGPVRLGAQNTGTTLDVRNKSNANRKISGVADATLSATSTEAVTGKQLNATNTAVADARSTAVAAQAGADAVRNRVNASALALGADAVAETNAFGISTALGQGARSYNGQSVALGFDARAGVDKDGNKVANANAGVSVGAKSRSGNGGVAMGLQAQAEGDRAVAVGNDAKSNALHASAVGYRSEASGEKAAALGADARATGQYATATGHNTRATGDRALASGVNAQATGANSSALGSGAKATHSNSVALGAGSVSYSDNSVSVGNASNRRKLQYVADGSVGAGSTDAVTGSQLHATNTSVSAAQTAATAAQHTADGVVTRATALEGLVSQVSATGNLRLGGQNTGTVLDVRNRSNAARKLSGVADGTVSATSTEAVTGKQLNVTNTNVTAAQNAAATAQTAATAAQRTADGVVGRATALEGLVSQVSASGNLRLGAQNTGTTLDLRNKSNAARKLSGVADGTLSATSTDAVTGKQLFGTQQKVTAQEGVLATHALQLSGQDGRITGNRRDLDALRTEFENFDPDLDGVVKFAADGSIDMNGGRVRGLAAGDVSSAASTDAVNGGQLFATNQRLERVERDGEFIAVDWDGESLKAKAGSLGVAIGSDSQADASGATAVGAYTEAGATNSVAIGRGARVLMGSDYGFALGSGSEVAASSGVALGAAAHVISSAESSIALGATSVARDRDTLSVGNDTLKRRIVNVGRGVDDHDVVNVLQASQIVLALGGGARLDANGNLIPPSYNVQGETFDTVGDAISGLDGALAATGSQVNGLEESLRSTFQSLPTTRSDGINHVNLAGRNGMVLGNVANGLIAPGSRDAVNGGQLHAAEQKIERNRNEIDGLRDQLQPSDGARLTGMGGLIDFDGARLTGIDDALLSADSSDAVTGRQLHASNHQIGENKQDIDKLRADVDDLDPDLGNVVKFTAGGSLVELEGARIVGLAAGDISSIGSTDAVNGGQLFATNQRVSSIEQSGRFVAVNFDDESTAAQAGEFSVAIGNGAEAGQGTNGATAIGAYARARARSSVALGRASFVDGAAENSFALGTGSTVLSKNGIAFGSYARVETGAEGSVALGAESTATEDKVVSVGNLTLKRRIVNLARGRDGDDAATVGQLRGALATLGGDVDTNGNVVGPTFNVQGGLQHTVSDALSVLDGAVLTNGTRVDRVENQLRSVFQDSPATHTDGLNQLNLAGANGMVLGNVANGLIAPGSRDAVNGGQLHAMEQRLDGRIDGLEQRVDTPLQGRAMATASAPTPPVAAEEEGSGAASGSPEAASAGDGGGRIASADDGGKPSKADAPAPAPTPTPQVSTADLEKMLARANEYTDDAIKGVEQRLDKMDKRFNRLAAMNSAQSAMAMNTAGLATYNRLGAGVGYSDGESAMAVGYQRVLNEKGSATFSLNGAFTNSGEQSVGLGVGIGW